MFFACFLSLSFLGVVFFNVLLLNEIQWVNAGHDHRYPDDLINDPGLGPLPPRPGERGSQVPSNWRWDGVSVDDLCSVNPHTQNRAQRLFQKNTLYSILTGQENETRKEYEAKEREHIRNKQMQYNENMKKQWKKDRMNSLRKKYIA